MTSDTTHNKGWITMESTLILKIKMYCKKYFEVPTTPYSKNVDECIVKLQLNSQLELSTKS